MRHDSSRADLEKGTRTLDAAERTRLGVLKRLARAVLDGVGTLSLNDLAAQVGRRIPTGLGRSNDGIAPMERTAAVVTRNR